MPAAGLKKRWKYNVIKGIISANEENLLEMPFLSKKGEYINLNCVISMIAKLSWYVYIGARLLEIGMTVNYIGRYTKKPVISETRLIHFDSKWIIFKFKDYSNDCKISIKKMRLFTFITYLTQHIPEKYFRLVQGYGMFSIRLRGGMLTLARGFIGQASQDENVSEQKSWRDRIKEYTGKDPLICEKCLIEMVSIFECFEPDYYFLKKIGISVNDKIPSKQLQWLEDSG